VRHAASALDSRVSWPGTFDIPTMTHTVRHQNFRLGSFRDDNSRTLETPHSPHSLSRPIGRRGIHCTSATLVRQSAANINHVDPNILPIGAETQREPHVRPHAQNGASPAVTAFMASPTSSQDSSSSPSSSALSLKYSSAANRSQSVSSGVACS
jgi:hypothetical protein